MEGLIALLKLSDGERVIGWAKDAWCTVWLTVVWKFSKGSSFSRMRGSVKFLAHLA